MHGIREIRESNENPSAFSREPQHGYHDGTDGNRSFESNLADKRRREAGAGRPWDGTADHARVLNAKKGEGAFLEAILGDILGIPAKKTERERIVDDLFFTALLLDVAAHAKATGNKPVASQENIHSAIDVKNDTPFFKFWARLNERLNATGYVEAGYKQAKEAFDGGKTPVGAMTFIGKQWDGLRAVPSEPVKYLGGTRPAYHGEYRTVTEDGTVWHKVLNSHDLPIAYTIPEAAVTAAEQAREKAVPNKAHR